MFEHPPAWTEPLANLTAWFHWPAWSAIFSSLALVWAINLGNRGALDQRRRDAVLLFGISANLNVAISSTQRCVERYRELESNGTDPKQLVRTIAEAFSEARGLETLSSFDPKLLPTPESVRALLAAQVVVRHIVAIMRQYLEGERENLPLELLEKRTETLVRYRKTIRSEAVRRHESFAGRLGRLFSSLRDAERRS